MPATPARWRRERAAGRRRAAPPLRTGRAPPRLACEMLERMKGLWTQTPREKAATVDGINLFFGALLGANLGTIDGLGLLDYAEVIFVLAGTVMTLRIFSTSERRGYAFGLLALYVVAVACFLFLLKRNPVGISPADVDRLAVTLTVWLGAVLLVEIHPTMRAGKDQA